MFSRAPNTPLHLLFIHFFLLGNILIAVIGMVAASVLLLLGFIMSIIKKCSRYSEHGHKVIAGILTFLMFLGGKVFQNLFTIGADFCCY